VAQEVFLRAFRHLDGFRPGSPFGAWIYRVSVNAAHDHLAQAWRRRRDEAPWSDDLERRAGPPEAGSDLPRRLEAALRELTERERAVFVLLELEGLEGREVAKALGISRITVRRHLGLARTRLRAILEGGGPERKSDAD
jgi:RNA polymerase sigma-70 factor (ECF subfamily)